MRSVRKAFHLIPFTTVVSSFFPLRSDCCREEERRRRQQHLSNVLFSEEKRELRRGEIQTHY